jgi:hypothetical protein
MPTDEIKYQLAGGIYRRVSTLNASIYETLSFPLISLPLLAVNFYYTKGIRKKVWLLPEKLFSVELKCLLGWQYNT